MKTRFRTLEIDDTHKPLLLVTLNRPDVRNALNSVMMQELRDLWQGLYVDSGAVQGVVLTGKGDKAFCAGADLKERNAIDVKTWQKQHAVLEQMIVAMQACPVPVIAAVNGVAYGGGLELTLASDFAYAAGHATFALPETAIGIMPGAMGTQNLPRACGLRRAKEICFTGNPFSAQEALEWGIVNRVCAPGDLLAQALKTMEKICRNAPLATRQVKKSLNATQHTTIAGGYLYEIEAYNQLLPTKDREEGIAAFNEKRRPKFTGR